MVSNRFGIYHESEIYKNNIRVGPFICTPNRKPIHNLGTFFDLKMCMLRHSKALHKEKVQQFRSPYCNVLLYCMLIHKCLK